jgi:hypothetical protein
MSKSRKIVKFKNLDDSDTSSLTEICDYPEKLLTLLEFCANNRYRKNIDRVITWIVNHRLEKLLEVAVENDQFLLNRLFATKANKSNSMSVTIDVFYEIQRRMENPPDHNRLYFIAAVLDVADTDFDSLSTEILPPSDLDQNYEDFIRYIIKEYFEIRDTTRLLAMLSRHVDFEIFDVIWRRVDDSNTAAVSEFLGNHLCIPKNFYERHIFHMNTSAQCQVALNVSSRCLAHSEVFTRSEKNGSIDVGKCLIFRRPFETSLELVEEFRPIFDIQKKIALIIGEELAQGKDFEEKETLIQIVSNLFVNADTEYRETMLEIVFKNCKDNIGLKLVETLFLDMGRSTGATWTYVGLSVEHRFKIFQLMYSTNYELFKTVYLVGEFLRELTDSRIDLKTIPEDRLWKEFLPLFLDWAYPSRNNGLCWMADNHFMQLRKFESSIVEYCLRYQTEANGIYGVVRNCLSKQSQLQFQDSFFDKIKSDFYIVEDSLFLEDKEFLQKMRTWINQQKPKTMPDHHRSQFGSIVALYGDEASVEVILTLDMPDVLCEYLFSSYCQNITLLSATVRRILDKVAEGFKKQKNKLSYICELVLDSMLAIMIRYGFTDHPLFEQVSDEKTDDCILSYLENKISCNQTIDEVDISRFLYSSKFEAAKHRLSQATLTKEAKNIICQKYPYFNILCRDASHPEFVRAVLTVGRREKAGPAYKEYQKLTHISSLKAQLAAHWFLVDDFDIEIETVGYHGMFELAKYSIEAFQLTGVATCRE